MTFSTGSGKTAAFLLPMLERLKTHSAKVMIIISNNGNAPINAEPEGGETGQMWGI